MSSLINVMTNGKNALRAYDYALSINTANMGNLQTSGYKALEYSFQTIFNQMLNGGAAANLAAGTGGINPVQLGGNISISDVKLSVEQGEIVDGSDMELALLGRGVFAVSEDAGQSFMYTRAGDFKLNENGYVVDSHGRNLYGFKMRGDGKADTSQMVPIHSDGNLDVGWAYKQNDGILIENYSAFKEAIMGDEAPPPAKQLYQVAVTAFPNMAGLLQYDGTTLKASAASGEPLSPTVSGGDYGTVYTQSRENSNVFYIGEMLDAMEIQRAMSASMTAIKIANQQLESIIQQLGQ